MRAVPLAAVMLGLGLGLGPASPARAAPGEDGTRESGEDRAAEPELRRVTLRGRVREAGGSRAPVVAATVLIVDAPADVRPGKVARDPLDPNALAWMLQAESDEDGNFVIP
ncbi:MAG: hypothetical protein KC457_33045, partial [Myxococcales bacterium]|nr:hypothetical protein [Myxococcales bacterium]